MLARGDYEVDLDWKDGSLTKAMIRADANSSAKCVVRQGDKTATLELAPGSEKILTPESFE